MFRIIITSMLCCLLLGTAATPSYAQQTLQPAEWETLLKSLEKEDWASSEKLSLSYLARYTAVTDTTGIVPTLRYMYVRSVAAMLASKKYTAEQALKKVAAFSGKEVITPTLMFRKTGLFNIVKLTEDSTSFFICGANDKATEIQTFEIYETADAAMMSQTDALEGKKIKLYAIITTITTGGTVFPHLEIRLSNTQVFVDEH